MLSSAQAPDVRIIDAINAEIVMVRLQGDFAKPPEKRFNYKHCFDALFRVSVSSTHCTSKSFRARYQLFFCFLGRSERY